MPAAAPVARTFMAAPMAGGYGGVAMPSPARPTPPMAKGKGGIMDRLRRSKHAEDGVASMERGLQPAPAPAFEAAEEVDTAALGVVAATAAREAQRLRAATAAPEYERRELLADLGTRLQALARDLGGSPKAQAVRALVAELTEDRLAGLAGAELTALWDRALAVLDALASPGGGSADTAARPAFWKRPNEV
jgi:Ca-activated chloride channel family protein